MNRRKVGGKARDLQKHARMLGLEYLGVKKDTDGHFKLMAQKNRRKMGPICVSSSCKRSSNRFCQDFTEEDREKIFTEFWNMDWEEKREFLKSMVNSVPTKRKRKAEPSRRHDTLNYYLEQGGELRRVCKKMFIQTLDLSEWMVREYALKQGGAESGVEDLRSLADKWGVCLK